MGTLCPYSSAPWTPVLRGSQLGSLGSQRKGAGGSADWFPVYDRCRWASGNLWGMLLLVESAPFGVVGLKCGSGGWRDRNGFGFRRGRTLDGPVCLVTGPGG